MKYPSGIYNKQGVNDVYQTREHQNFILVDIKRMLSEGLRELAIFKEKTLRIQNAVPKNGMALVE